MDDKDELYVLDKISELETQHEDKQDKDGSPNIIFNKPKDSSFQWINIFSDPDKYNASDAVADIGNQWIPGSNPQNQPDYHLISPASHKSAYNLFQTIIFSDITVAKYLEDKIRKFWSK